MKMVTGKTLFDGENPLMEEASEPLYVVVDADQVNEDSVYGVFTKFEYAEKAMEWLIQKMVKECLAVDPKESGIDAEFDIPWLEKDTRNSLKIQALPQGLNKVVF